ncbi:MAG: CADD family putative folate metabolism protein [Candidatus Marinimicrobia bacterium]|nr:CADD family putative folate metabolism protein [Candidatus Neomarinimicrobiota bacterium]
MPVYKDSEKHPFITQLDAVIERHAMLKHPFYEMWNEGGLSREALAEYAKQYYAHVQAFPTYVSAVHAHTDDIAVRQLLLENLIEEERGEANHPELWLRFAEGLGVDRQDVLGAELLDATRQSVAVLKRLSNRSDGLEGMAALYAYESQIPEVARTKREGLRDFYGLDDDRSVAFFTVHETADVEHRATERQIIAAGVTASNSTAVLGAADEAARALWSFLDGVYEAYCQGDVATA